MSNRWTNWGNGIEDGARHFFKHEKSSRVINAASGALRRNDKSVLYKARVVAAVAAYIAKTASPIGLAQNTYNSVKEGAKGYNYTRDDAWGDAIDAVVAPFKPDEQETIRRCLRNPTMPNDTAVVTGAWTAQRINEMFTDFELG